MASSTTTVRLNQNAAQSRGACATTQEFRNSDLNCFVKKDGETRVTVFESTGANSVFSKQLCKSKSDLESYFNTDRKPSFTIISIPQADSVSPIQITKDGMTLLFEHLRVSADFTMTLRSVGKPPHDAEYGWGNVIENQYENGSFDMTYLSRYYGYREWTDEGNPEVIRSWRPRQSGVYHAFDAAQESHLVIFLHAESAGSFHAVLDRLVENEAETEALHARPMLLHARLFSSYFKNWRIFLREKADQFRDDYENLLSQEMKNLELDVRFDRLQALHDLEDRISPLEPILATLSDQLQSLNTIDQFLTAASSGEENSSAKFSALPVNYFSSRKSLVMGLKTSAEAFQKRIHAASRLLESTLELRNQDELGLINQNLYKLQRENVDDSFIVKLITILSLMYLPASLVSSIFGMNFFSFSTTAGKAIDVNGLWLYAAVFVPLTLITVLILWGTWTYGKKKDDEDK